MSKIAAALLVRNEWRELPGWLAWHAMMGVDKFLIYDNASTDRTGDVLKSARSVWDITVTPWPGNAPDTQTNAYLHALRHCPSDWCLFLDADEYVASTNDERLPALLGRQAFDTSAVVLNWAVFGSNDYETYPLAASPLAFVRRAPLQDGCNRLVKSIVRPRRAIHALNPHLFEVIGNTVDAHGNLAQLDCVLGCSSDAPVVAPWRVNHYAVRSRQHWLDRVERGRASGHPTDPERWAQWDRNDELDLSAPMMLGMSFLHEHRRTWATA